MEDFLIYDGIMAAQTPKCVYEFSKIIKDFDLIVEIGTNRGAFTLWLADNMNENCNCISLEIDDNVIVKKHEKVHYWIADCFAKNTINHIYSEIIQSKNVLFLCDGGNKEKEFEIYCRLLRKNDVIMLHDYAHDKQDYVEITKRIFWPTASESHYENIAQIVENNGLAGYNYDEFKNVLWGSFIKL